MAKQFDIKKKEVANKMTKLHVRDDNERKLHVKDEGHGNIAHLRKGTHPYADKVTLKGVSHWNKQESPSNKHQY